jgi:hypothetical protein
MDISDKSVSCGNLLWDIKHSEGHERILHLINVANVPKTLEIAKIPETPVIPTIHEFTIKSNPKLRRIVSIKKIKTIRKYKKHK